MDNEKRINGNDKKGENEKKEKKTNEISKNLN